MDWIVYILECGDGTYYTGITNDLDKRRDMHERGIGAKYTRGRGPLKLVYTETGIATKSLALKRERAIKTMNRDTKEKLIKSGALL